MPVDSAFAPYRLAQGALADEAARAAEPLLAEPFLALPADPIPASLLGRTLALVAAGRAAPGAEPCRAADGDVSGGVTAPRACLASGRQRARVAEAVRGALSAGFAGVCLDRPDAPLALGLLGAGFCGDCQRDLARHLVREYGDHFLPPDYVAVVRGAIAQASGAVSLERIPFGRDFVRVRNDALVAAVREHARAARDAARAADRPFDVAARFEALGPAQLRSARHVDAAVFPCPVPPGDSGLGLFRLLRAVSGRRPAAVAPPAALQGPALARLAAAAAACAVDLEAVLPGGGRETAAVRTLARRLHARSLGPVSGDPVAECAILYSAEADLWTGGRHLRSVVRAGELLARLHAQAPVVTRPTDVPAGATLVLADASALAPSEAKEALRRLEGGGTILAFGEAAAADETGRPGPALLPSAKVSGTKVGAGTLAALPSLAPDGREVGPEEAAESLERALDAVRGRGRRAAGVASRVPLLVVLHRTAGAVLAHLVAPADERVQGATLFLGVQVAGGARRARFVSTDGTDVRIPLNPSGYSLSTVLPAFRGYAVLSLAA